MGTKVTIIGEHSSVKKEPKKIKLIKYLNGDLEFTNTNILPKAWKNIELICKASYTQYDLMFAYDNVREDGILYLGHFNDGIV